MEFKEAFIKDPITALRKATGFARFSKKNKKISALSDKLDREEEKQTKTQHNVALGGVVKSLLNRDSAKKAEQRRLDKLNKSTALKTTKQFKEPPKSISTPLPDNVAKPPKTSHFFTHHLSNLTKKFKRPFGVR